jgi:HSP20 family protein
MSDSWDDWFRRRMRRSPLFPDIDKLFEDVEKEMEDVFKDLQEKAPEDLVRERRLPDGSKVKEFGPFVYGYSITIGPDGKPVIREFGNMKPGLEGGRREPIALKEEREPLVDVFEEDDKIKIVAELPGVEKEDINLYAEGDRLTISVDTPERKYYKDLQLPTEIDPSTTETSYKSGILEVLVKKKEKKGKGVQLKIL